MWILAQADGEEAGRSVELNGNAEGQQESVTSQDGSTQTGDKEVPTQPGPGWPQQLLIMVPIFLIMYFLLFRGPKKKEQKHAQMVKELKKNDKVQTIGGIVGTIVDIRENEIVLKVDESNNTKMRFSKRAIATTLSEK